jgi:chromosome segregation ATPase
MDKYSELQSQAFQYHIERYELEDSYKIKVGQLENELRRCKSLLAEKESLMTVHLQESGSNIDSTLATQAIWETERDALQLRIEQAEAHAREELAKLEAQLTSKEAELTQIKDDLLKHTNAAQQLRTECAMLQDSLSTKDDIIAKCIDEQQQLTQQREQCAALYTTMCSETVSKDVVHAQADELVAVRALLTTEQELKDQLQRELSDRTGECNDLKAEIASKTCDLQSVLTQHGEKHMELECELSNTTKQLAEARNKIQDLERECKQLQEEIESANELDLSNIYERQLKQLQAEYACLQTNIQEMDARATEERANAIQIAQQLREDKQGLEDKIDSTRKDVQRLTEEATQLRENLCVVTGEASQWKEATAQANERLRTSLEEENIRQGEAQNLRNELLKSEEKALKEQAEANLRLSELANERDALRDEVTAIKHLVSEMESSKQEQLQLQLEEANAARKILQNELAVTLVRLEEIEGDLELARKESVTRIPFF